jgi:2-polyprenyl-6-methoxyphenol hydroxylase-like FAD-dependent oxidoreductase
MSPDTRLTMVAPKVLVVGAGIAGSTLAVLLARGGATTTLVERAQAQRSSGGPVDVRGAAVDVVAHMGLLASVRAAATQVRRLAVVDAAGTVRGWIPTQTSVDAVEIARSDLASILLGAATDDVEMLFDDTVERLRDDGAEVEVTFHRAGARRFDLVVGADGVHSQVRRLAFGPEQAFTTFLGMSIATAPLGSMAVDPHTVFMRSEPGRAALIHPMTGREGAAFIFRHPSPQVGGPLGDPGLLREVLAGHYSGMGWRVPEMLAAFDRVEDVYVDSVNRVVVGHWFRGRVVLVGDAAGCVTLFGEGSSLAILGAATLAESVLRGGDLGDVLSRYQRAHEQRLVRHHRGTALTAHLLVPATRAGLTLRGVGFRLWPTFAGPRRR